MPRHWRCTNGHTWAGELGALTYCPDCGSADVYEVRPPLQAEASPAHAPGSPDLGQTFVQSAPASVGDTYVQPVPSAFAAKVGDTLLQTPAALADMGATLVQPPLPGDTLMQPAAASDPGTTQEQ